MEVAPCNELLDEESCAAYFVERPIGNAVPLRLDEDELGFSPEGGDYRPALDERQLAFATSDT